MFVLVGLPGAGKTTEAVRLAAEHRALRLTPDEWMIPLFGDNDADGKRAVLEGRLISIALDVLRLGVSAVLDFGCWTRDERSALRWLAGQVSAEFTLIYVAVDPGTQQERVDRRWRATPQQTFLMTEAELAQWRELFEEPDADELAGRSVADRPGGWPSWREWAQDRWPSLTWPVPPARRRPTR